MTSIEEPLQTYVAMGSLSESGEPLTRDEADELRGATDRWDLLIDATGPKALLYYTSEAGRAEVRDLSPAYYRVLRLLLLNRSRHVSVNELSPSEAWRPWKTQSKAISRAIGMLPATLGEGIQKHGRLTETVIALRLPSGFRWWLLVDVSDIEDANPVRALETSAQEPGSVRIRRCEARWEHRPQLDPNARVRQSAKPELVFLQLSIVNADVHPDQIIGASMTLDGLHCTEYLFPEMARLTTGVTGGGMGIAGTVVHEAYCTDVASTWLATLHAGADVLPEAGSLTLELVRHGNVTTRFRIDPPTSDSAD